MSNDFTYESSTGPAASSYRAMDSSTYSQTVELTIHNGLEGFSGGQKIEGEDKVTKGAVTVANLNDTDGDGTSDQDDSDISAPAQKELGRKEIDMMKLIVNKPAPDRGGNVKLTISSGKVKLWEHATKNKMKPFLTKGTKEIKTNDLPKTLWIEAISASEKIRDIEIKLEYKGAEDIVKATAVWVIPSRQWFDRTKNPVPGPNKDIPDVSRVVADSINRVFIAKDGSRYGLGSYRVEAGKDTAIGGRILFEFEINPPGAETLGLVFDVTRQVEGITHQIGSGFSEIREIDKEKFPANEKPNDDLGPEALTEQIDPIRTGDDENKPAHLYSFDGPGYQAVQPKHNAFRIRRLNFYEWVRVQVNNTAFKTNVIEVGRLIDNQNETVQGSRCSPRLKWHLSLYGRHNGKNHVVDTTPVSFSEPNMLAAGDANGTLSITLLPEAETQGLLVQYKKDVNDGNKLKWELKVDGANAVFLTKSGTSWSHTLDNKFKVSITEGTMPFKEGAIFTSTVFKTSASSGKKLNSVGLGHKDFTGDP